MGNKTHSECHYCHKLSQNNKLKYRDCKLCNQTFCSECNDNPIVLKNDMDKFVK